MVHLVYDYKAIESEMRNFWRKINLLEKIKHKNHSGRKYFLLDGPPYANDVPHVGHIRNTVFKDLYIRWELMKGSNVLFQPGFDTHGLPIENMVEKKLGLESKKDIEKLGIAEFMKQCKNSATLNKDLWMEVYDLLGSWYSWKEPYLTYDNGYIESAWWAFKQMWKREMVYEGKKPVFWCPKCQTALSGYEISDSYKNLTDPAIYVKFKIKDKDEYILVFTTTPWTLPANVVICAHPEKDYVKVKTADHGILIIAKKRLPLLDELDIDYTIIDEFKGKALDGIEYEPLLDLPIQQKLKTNPKALRVYMSIPILKERVGSKLAVKKSLDTSSGDVFEDFVSDEEGTGFVHCAPGHGKTDNEVGKHYGLPELSPLDDECKFTDEAGEYKGKFVKDADHDIAEAIHQAGKLLHYSKIEHSYPLCWRCKSPLIFRMSNQWFFKVDSIKQKMLDANERVNWQPEFARERFRNWVINAEDWNFTRQRYWGIPVPIWKCECGNIIVVGSLEELKEKSTDTLKDDFDLHSASEVKLRCDKCGKEATRINDIFDVWFDSGCAPFSALHYPFENKSLFESHFPVSRVNESQDQIRGWFYSLMFVNMATFGKEPYKTVSMPGWVLDSKGEKMSKSLGNVVFGKEAIEEFSADVIRFYYCWDIAPSSTQKFSKEIIKTEVSKYFNILWNISRLLLASRTIMQQPSSTEIEDKWILSRLESTTKKSRQAIEDFEIHLAGREIYNFVVNDLSRTYIQLVRDRMEADNTPYNIINHALLKTLKLTASITPYISDFLYQELKLINKDLKESIHLEDLPDYNSSLIDATLERDMQLVYEVITAILAARDKAKLGVRWPLNKVIVDTASDETKSAIKLLGEIIKKQTNISAISIEPFKVSLSVKPNFSTLGKQFGQETGDVAVLIKEKAADIVKALEQGQEIIKIGNYSITKDHLLISKEVSGNYEMAEFKHGCVFIETTLTEELLAEGYSREIIRRIQNLRKKHGLNKDDKIDLMIVSDEKLLELIKPNLAVIEKKVGASTLTISSEQPQEAFNFSGDATIKEYKIHFYFNKV